MRHRLPVKYAWLTAGTTKGQGTQCTPAGATGLFRTANCNESCALPAPPPPHWPPAPPPWHAPNILFILSDDLGFNDISLHGSPQIPTPHIDALARAGVTLMNCEVEPSLLLPNDPTHCSDLTEPA